jgi:methylated-DNA-[protein]-cysteine S-methyltransferase
MSIYKFLYRSPIGPILITSDDFQLLSISFSNDQDTSKEIPENLPLIIAVRWLDAYFSGQPEPIESVPALVNGTDFQKQCWQELCRIPYGQTITYKELANRVGTHRGVMRMSCQAVGQAIRKNPFAILIPCHRVIGSNGDLIGYAWGLEFKRELLAYERKKCCD